MITLNVHEIKAHFSKYLDLLEAGETIVICRRNKPIAELRSLKSKTPRQIGLGKGLAKIDESFFEPLESGLLLPE